MQNSDLMRELNVVLKEMDYFNVYQSSKYDLQKRLSMATTDGDRIRAILRDSTVQEYLFPDYRISHEFINNPVDYYVQLRKNGTIPPK